MSKKKTMKNQKQNRKQKRGQKRNKKARDITAMICPFPKGFNPFDSYPVQDAFPHSPWAKSPYFKNRFALVPVRIPYISLDLTAKERDELLGKYRAFIDLVRRNDIRHTAEATIDDIMKVLVKKRARIKTLEKQISKMEAKVPIDAEEPPKLTARRQRLQVCMGSYSRDVALCKRLEKLCKPRVQLPRWVRKSRNIPIVSYEINCSGQRVNERRTGTELKRRLVAIEDIYEFGLDGAFSRAMNEWVVPDEDEGGLGEEQ